MKFLSKILFFALPVYAMAIVVGEVSYEGVRTTANELGLTTTVAANGKDITWSGSSDKAQLELHQRMTVINGTRVLLNFPVAEAKNRYYVSTLDVNKTFKPLITPERMTVRQRLRHIVIDPGHGGKDNGAEYARYKAKEKIFVLDIAKRLAENLREAGYKVTLTRTDDKFIELKDRPALANRLGADLFISVHLNASVDRKIAGAETFAYPPQGAPSATRLEANATDKMARPANRYDTANLWAAYDIQKSLIKHLPTPDRGVKRTRYKVLESIECPAVLIEGGFISNPAECSRLTTGLYRQQLADAITAGVQNYHRRLLAGK